MRGARTVAGQAARRLDMCATPDQPNAKGHAVPTTKQPETTCTARRAKAGAESEVAR